MSDIKEEWLYERVDTEKQHTYLIDHDELPLIFHWFPKLYLAYLAFSPEGSERIRAIAWSPGNIEELKKQNLEGAKVWYWQTPLWRWWLLSGRAGFCLYNEETGKIPAAYYFHA